MHNVAVDDISILDKPLTNLTLSSQVECWEVTTHHITGALTFSANLPTVRLYLIQKRLGSLHIKREARFLIDLLFSRIHELALLIPGVYTCLRVLLLC